MLQALLSTITELLDSKKAAYSFIATIIACVLHLHFGVDPTNAILLVSPLGAATLAQAHVDAKTLPQATVRRLAKPSSPPPPPLPVSPVPVDAEVKIDDVRIDG